MMDAMIQLSDLGLFGRKIGGRLVLQSESSFALSPRPSAPSRRRGLSAAAPALTSAGMARRPCRSARFLTSRPLHLVEVGSPSDRRPLSVRVDENTPPPPVDTAAAKSMISPFGLRGPTGLKGAAPAILAVDNRRSHCGAHCSSSSTSTDGLALLPLCSHASSTHRCVHLKPVGLMLEPDADNLSDNLGLRPEIIRSNDRVFAPDPITSKVMAWHSDDC